MNDDTQPTSRLRHWSRRLTVGLAVAGVASALLVAIATPASAASSTLGSGQRLNGGGEITAGSYRLVMQTDGNLVEYNSANTALWYSHTAGQAGNYAVMQTDGNLVVYSSGGSWRWQSTTNGYSGAHLAIQTDGNVVVYSSGGSALWAKSWTQTAAGAQAYAQVSFVHYGWSTGSQYSPLLSLWTRESNWRWNADNQSSGAYGIPQSLPASKMAANGPDYETDGLTQVAWGLAYIHSVYGTPQAAWNHEVADGWY